MRDKGSRPAANVIPIGVATGKKAPTPGKAKKESEKKWGKPVMARGFQIIPSLLLRAQADLRLGGRQLAILVHILDHWWEANRIPFPSKALIAKRMQLSERQVQRAIATMERRSLIRRVARYSAQGGQSSNYYSFAGLVAQLKALEPAYRKADEELRARRRALERPRGRTVVAVAE